MWKRRSGSLLFAAATPVEASNVVLRDGTRIAVSSAEADLDTSLYAVAAALSSRMQALDSIANNLANASTSGYRAQTNSFQAVLGGVVRDTPLNHVVNSYGVLGQSGLDLSQGALERTGNELDLGIQGEGFFTVQTPSGIVYTRNGNFRLSPVGDLITQDGNPVVGDSGPIKIAGGAVDVSADGTISSGGALLGKLRIVNFPRGTAITSRGNSYYSAPGSTAVPATGAQVQQGMLEGSNVNPIVTAVELVNVQRSAEMMQRTLSIFHSEFNKTAAEELPHVS